MNNHQAVTSTEELKMSDLQGHATLNKKYSHTRSSQKRPETAFLKRIIHFPPLQLAESFQI